VGSQVSHVVTGHLTYCSVATVYEWHQVPQGPASLENYPQNRFQYHPIKESLR